MIRASEYVHAKKLHLSEDENKHYLKTTNPRLIKTF